MSLPTPKSLNKSKNHAVVAGANRPVNGTPLAVVDRSVAYYVRCLSPTPRARRESGIPAMLSLPMAPISMLGLQA